MRFVKVFLISGFIATSIAAQAQVRGNISASSTCGQSVVHQMATVGDEGQHTISLDQRVCAWSPAIVIGGMQGTRYTATGVDDVQFDKSRDRGYAVGTVENGDKYFLSYDGTATMNGPAPVHLEGLWYFTGGTGKLAGLKGSGTYKARPTADGRMAFVIEGVYTISAIPSKDLRQVVCAELVSK